ncbi:MAG TPA: tetratricopeptide repeat protein [Thermoanaerobaculia bacterium]|nr:tetratricopeptide repeat protein [Thermoanaerobaculia bacterium]
MTASHSTTEDFAKFIRDPAEPASFPRNTRLVRHLLAACAPCQQSLAKVVSKPAEGSDYGEAFAAAERSLTAFLATDHPSESSPEELLAELSFLPGEEQANRVATDGRYAFPSFVKHLIDESHAVRYQDAARMLHLANLARLAAEACPVKAAGSEPKRNDVLAQSWRQYGNALRVLGRLREAEAAITTGQCYLQAGTRDPRLRARQCTQTASLRMSQRRFEEAIEQAEEARQIYGELEDNHSLASTMVQKSIACLYAGEPEEALQILNGAIPFIDSDRDPHLLLCACHNLVRCYIDLGRPEQALSLYKETRDLYRSSNDPLIRLRAAWWEGLLLRDLGQLPAAEATLLRARQGFVERDLFYEAALVSLDLAAVYVKLQAELALKQIVAETIPIFRALGVDREALASLLQLQQLSHQSRQAFGLLRFLNSRIEQLLPRQTVF